MNFFYKILWKIRQIRKLNSCRDAAIILIDLEDVITSEEVKLHIKNARLEIWKVMDALEKEQLTKKSS